MGRPFIKDKRICYVCGSDRTYVSKTGPHWRKIDGEFFCQRCNQEYFDNPTYNARYKGRLMAFKGKTTLAKRVPKIGVCSLCHKKVGDNFINRSGILSKIKRTSLHHLEYHLEDPLKDTIEVCNSCHSRLHCKIWKDEKRGLFNYMGELSTL